MHFESAATKAGLDQDSTPDAGLSRVGGLA
jgi:hypothetical protein